VPWGAQNLLAIQNPTQQFGRISQIPEMHSTHRHQDRQVGGYAKRTEPLGWAKTAVPDRGDGGGWGACNINMRIPLGMSSIQAYLQSILLSI
jgi:hypothetical protein